MTLTINGKEQTFDQPQLALAELIGRFGLTGQPLLVEHNGEALHPAQQRELTLRDGDRLELLRMVAGG